MGIEMAAKRDATIDFIKGMLILGVVYGHTMMAFKVGNSSNTIWLHTFLRTFDMPFFMILSGLFFSKSLSRDNALDVFINRVTTILVPIICWTLIRGHLNVFCGMYYFLWAVFVSCMICLCANLVARHLAGHLSKAVEVLVLLLATALLHCYNVPWNLFYLFPFFAIGYCIKAIPVKFSQWSESAIILIWVTGLCFWKTEYSPWSTNGIAWQTDYKEILVYAYRYSLALLGVHVMWRFLSALRFCLGVESWFVKLIARAGAETLAIYIVHSLLISVLKRGVKLLPSCCWENTGLIGYVVAPVISLIILVALLPVIKCIKGNVWAKNIFGFKMK